MEENKEKSYDTSDNHGSIEEKEKHKMSDAISLSRELNKKIKESDLYVNYIKCRKTLCDHPDLLNGLIEFKRKNEEIENNLDIENPFEDINNLVKEYDDLVHDTTVSEYLKAERKLCRMMRTVYEEIADGLLVDIK